MKQQYLILGFLIIMIVVFFSSTWAKTRKQENKISKKTVSNNNQTNDKLRVMEIKRNDIEQSNDVEDILYELTQKYYPDYDNFEKLYIVSQTFVLIVDADGQINNGGIVQFIDNSTGNRFLETIDASKRIKSDSLLNILTRITIQFPNKQIPQDWNKRRIIWDKLCEQHENDDNWEKFWEKLDDSYYANSKEIYQNLIDYLKNNAKIIE